MNARMPRPYSALVFLGGVMGSTACCNLPPQFPAAHATACSLPAFPQLLCRHSCIWRPRPAVPDDWGVGFRCTAVMATLPLCCRLGHSTCHFNVGQYRRLQQSYSKDPQDASFFDPSNKVGLPVCFPCDVRLTLVIITLNVQ